MKRLQIKYSEDEKEAWNTQKEKDGYTSLAAWMRSVLNANCEDKPVDVLQGLGEHNRKSKPI